jgi:hypothetical protein
MSIERNHAANEAARRCGWEDAFEERDHIRRCNERWFPEAAKKLADNEQPDTKQDTNDD